MRPWSPLVGQRGARNPRRLLEAYESGGSSWLEAAADELTPIDAARRKLANEHNALLLAGQKSPAGELAVRYGTTENAMHQRLFRLREKGLLYGSQRDRGGGRR